MLSNAYFLAKFRFDTAENEPAKNLQNFREMHFRKMHFRKMHFRKMHFRSHLRLSHETGRLVGGAMAAPSIPPDAEACAFTTALTSGSSPKMTN